LVGVEFGAIFCPCPHITVEVVEVMSVGTSISDGHFLWISAILVEFAEHDFANKSSSTVRAVYLFKNSLFLKCKHLAVPYKIRLIVLRLVFHLFLVPMRTCVIRRRGCDWW